MKINFHVTVAMAFAVALILHGAVAYGQDPDAGIRGTGGRAKNIIIMVPDGLGLADVTAARVFLNGPNGARLSFEKMEAIGYQSTHAADALVTDSAAAASAWAVGEKFAKGEISCHADRDISCTDDKAAPQTILEIAASKGKATGLVVTSQISHATPAAFGAHSHSRNCGAEIARQYIEETGVNIILGGGISDTKTECANYETSYGWTLDGDNGRAEIMDSAAKYDYTVVESKQQLAAAVSTDRRRVLGLFDATNRGKSVEMFRVDPAAAYPAEEPTLAEMTGVALDILHKDADGFFLLVEGSQIDWQKHANNIQGQIAEVLGFNAAVDKVLGWVEKHGRNDTLVMVAPDHETGGFAINGPTNAVSEAGSLVTPGWTSNDHTATDTLLWCQGPGSRLCGRALDNTDLFRIMAGVLP